MLFYCLYNLETQVGSGSFSALIGCADTGHSSVNLNFRRGHNIIYKNAEECKPVLIQEAEEPVLILLFALHISMGK